MMRLRHRVAVVTGSSRGIGRAIAQALAREGAAVVLNAARSIGEAQAAADAIVRAGGRALAVQADVGDPGDARALIGQAAEALGRFIQPEEIGRAAVFLASDESAYITGQTLMVSGGVVTG